MPHPRPMSHPQRQSLYLHVCSWCLRYTKPPEWGVWSGKPVDTSHGLCRACLEKHFPDAEHAAGEVGR